MCYISVYTYISIYLHKDKQRIVAQKNRVRAKSGDSEASYWRATLGGNKKLKAETTRLKKKAAS